MAGEELALGKQLLERARSKAFSPRHRLSLLSAEAAIQEAVGDTDDASGTYDRAFQGWTEHGHVLEMGLALLGAGRCLATMDRPLARDRLDQAKTIFEGLGAVRLVAEVDRLE